jgi:hypothetical protein
VERSLDQRASKAILKLHVEGNGLVAARDTLRPQEHAVSRETVLDATADGREVRHE